MSRVVVVNDVKLAVDETGSGQALVFVHGGWVDRHAWDGVTPGLADRFRVISYDRRGHSQSERSAGRNDLEAHAADLAALLDNLDAAPAHIVTSSIGGNIALKMAVQHPERVASLCLHEPPMLGLVDDPTLQHTLEQTQHEEEQVRQNIRQGDHEEAARHFFDQLAVGPGTWEMLPEPIRQTVAANAPAWLEESQGAWSTTESDELETVTSPVLLTGGGAHPPDYPYPLAAILDRLASLLPHADRYTFQEAGHVPHQTHPHELVEVVGDFLEQHPLQ